MKLQPVGTTIAYYLAAADSSGRHETLPSTAPLGFYRFTVVGDPSGIEPGGGFGAPALNLGPNPFAPGAGLSLAIQDSPGTILEIQDLTGRIVARLLFPASGTLRWNGRDRTGRPCAAGLYLLSAKEGAEVRRARCLIVR